MGGPFSNKVLTLHLTTAMPLWMLSSTLPSSQLEDMPLNNIPQELRSLGVKLCKNKEDERLVTCRQADFPDILEPGKSLEADLLGFMTLLTLYTWKDRLTHGTNGPRESGYIVPRNSFHM